MNKIIIAGMALFGGVALTACDNISEEDRFIPVEKPVLPPQAVEKNVLIFDFSGIQCKNCPDGARVIQKIRDANPGRIIPVAIHSSLNNLSVGIPITNLNCTEADVMYKYFEVGNTLPAAFFNGKDKSTEINSWFTPATKALEQPTYITISAEASYENATRMAQIDYSVRFSNDLNDDLSVMVWVIENDIVGYQIDGNQYLMDYVHNHILRGSLNGDWGTQLGSSFQNGQVIEGTASGKINEKWNADNCHIVVYVFRDSDKFVEQTIEIPLISSGTEEPEE